MNTIHICGCSLSDSFNTTLNWTELLGVPVTNHSAIAGSNQRTWRRLHDAVAQGARRVIMQITTLDRKEWWTDLKPANDHDHYIEQYGEHYTFKFKWGSHIDNPHGLLRKASKINYNFIDERWERDDFLRQHAQFTAWCSAQGAEILCVASETYLDCVPQGTLNITDILTQHHLPADEWHLDTQGHTLVADRVREHIKKSYPHWL